MLSFGEPPGMAVAAPDAAPPLLDGEPGCDGLSEGNDELEPAPSPLGEGVGEGALRPEPLPPGESLDVLLAEEEGEELGGVEGRDVDEDWPAQPPIRRADTALMAVT